MTDPTLPPTVAWLMDTEDDASWAEVDEGMDMEPEVDHSAVKRVVRLVTLDAARAWAAACVAQERERAMVSAPPEGVGMTDEEIERLIDNSDGHWREDVFCIGGPELSQLLRAAVLSKNGMNAGTSGVAALAPPHPAQAGGTSQDEQQARPCLYCGADMIVGSECTSASQAGDCAIKADTRRVPDTKEADRG